MFTGFEKIVEERIQSAQKDGTFNDLPGSGKPLSLMDDGHIPEDLRLAHKILKNADCLPPEIEIKKEILQTEALLANMPESKNRYRILKKINYLVTKFNTMRSGPIQLDLPQLYLDRVANRLADPCEHGDDIKRHTSRRDNR